MCRWNKTIDTGATLRFLERLLSAEQGLGRQISYSIDHFAIQLMKTKLLHLLSWTRFSFLQYHIPCVETLLFSLEMSAPSSLMTSFLFRRLESTWLGRHVQPHLQLHRSLRVGIDSFVVSRLRQLTS